MDVFSGLASWRMPDGRSSNTTPDRACGHHQTIGGHVAVAPQNAASPTPAASQQLDQSVLI